MTQSMTGFGAAEGAVGADRLRIELRSVNHRHLQVQWKLPYELQALEQDLRDRVRKALERGHVSGSAQWVTDGVRPSSVRLDAQRARDTLAALKELKKTLKLKGDLDLAALARMPGVLTTADEGAAAAPKVDAAAVYRLADAALAALGDMRGREGAALGDATFCGSPAEGTRDAIDDGVWGGRRRRGRRTVRRALPSRLHHTQNAGRARALQYHRYA